MPRASKLFFALSVVFGSVALLLLNAEGDLITEPQVFADTPMVLTRWGIFAVSSEVLAITMMVTAVKVWLTEWRKLSRLNNIK